MKFKRIEPKSLLSILIKRLIIFLCIMNMVLLLLYGIGNYQGFLADTQLLLLNLVLDSNVLLVLSSIIACIYSVVQRKRGFSVYFGYGTLAFFGSLLSLASAFLIQLTQGYGN